MGAFETSCKTCGTTIKMVPTGEKKADGKDRYLPRNLDGSQHRCSPSGQPQAPDTRVYAGILKSSVGNGVLISTEEGRDRTYAVSKTLLPPSDLPIKITFRLLPKNYVEIVEFGEPVKKTNPPGPAQAPVAPVSNDRLDGPADGECASPPGGELIRPPQEPEPEPEIVNNCTSSSPARTWTEIPQVTIGITVNLQNFENLKIEVKGAASDRDQLKDYTQETALMFGTKNPPTREMIESYVKRVF